PKPASGGTEPAFFVGYFETAAGRRARLWARPRRTRSRSGVVQTKSPLASRDGGAIFPDRSSSYTTYVVMPNSFATSEVLEKPVILSFLHERALGSPGHVPIVAVGRRECESHRLVP